MAELLYGAYHGQHRETNLPLLERLFSVIAPVAFDWAAASHAGRIRAQLAADGLPIGPNDLLIAASAIAHGLILVTHNTGEFQRVPGLIIEDWETAI